MVVLAVILECWAVEYILQGHPGRCGCLVQPHLFPILSRVNTLFHLLPSLSSKFATAGRRGTRLMLVNEVALGECKVLHQRQRVPFLLPMLFIPSPHLSFLFPINISSSPSIAPPPHLSQDYWNEAKTLDKPPEGYNSVRGVKCTEDQPTLFKVLYH